MAVRIVLANHKGGCAKTTTAANLASALAADHELRVLCVDADPQANLTELLAGDPVDDPRPRLEHALTTPDMLDEAVWTTRQTGGGEVPLAGGLHLLGCSEQLADLAATHTTNSGFALALTGLLDRLDSLYDVVVIDTPPGLGALSTLGLVAADWCIVPARPADFDVAGAIKLADLIDGDLQAVNPDLRLLGVLVCQADPRWTLTRETTAALKAAGVRKLKVEIPFSVRAGRAPRRHAPTVLTDPDGRLADAYRRLADDLRAVLARPAEAA